MAGPATYSSNAFTNTTTHGSGASADLDIDFDQSNKSQLGTADVFFSLDDGGSNPTVYKIAGAVINEASIDFDIEGIAQIAWSGQGQSIEEAASINTGTSATNDSNSQSVAAETTDGLINEGISSTSNYVRNKLTDLTIVYDQANTSGTKGLLGSSNTTYSVTLTGGNVTIGGLPFAVSSDNNSYSAAAIRPQNISFADFMTLATVVGSTQLDFREITNSGCSRGGAVTADADDKPGSLTCLL